MPTTQEHIDLTRLEQLRGQLRGDQDLLTQLGSDSEALAAKENAAKQILAVTKDRPEDAGDYQRATDSLAKLAVKRAQLEERITNAKWRISATQERIGRFDLPKLNRAASVRDLVAKLAGV